MTIKKAIILFLIFFLAPVVFGKVQLAPFADFFQNPSWDAFKTAFEQVFQDDWNFYKGFFTPWVSKIIDLIKGNLPPGTENLVP